MNSNRFILIILIFVINMFNFSNGKSSNDKSFYDISIKSIEGTEIKLNEYKNKAVLIVNVASYCGFTKQYEELQKLWDLYKDNGLIVLGIPSKSFNQEMDTENEVKEFCETRFNINFPMTSIYDVRGESAHDLYKWAKNDHGKSAIPKWNFYKILINKNGKVEETFTSLTKPLSDKLLRAIKKILN